MIIHKEGTQTLIFTCCMIIGLGAATYSSDGIRQIVFGATTGIFVLLLPFFLWFFRYPNRKPKLDANHIICPADGKVVVIEKTVEKEYFKEERIQLSIFMSPLDVHAQWYPVDGEVCYSKYHPGKHLVAWHPKSSELNEMSTIVISSGTKKLLVRQIAGAVARRIVTYSKEFDKVKQGDNFGFIKFGSRVDVLLPVNAEILVDVNDKVVGNETVLARW